MNGLSDVRLTLHSQELAAGQEKGLRSAMLRNPPSGLSRWACSGIVCIHAKPCWNLHPNSCVISG